MFDLHTDNRDRWEENYNLLIRRGAKTDFYTIDHIACFCGNMNIAKFTPKIKFNVNHSIFKSPYYQQVMSYIDYEELVAEIDKYVYLSHPFDKIQGIINDVFAYIPHEWKLSAGLQDRIIAFLSDESRLDAISCEVKQLILYYKNNPGR
jgi:hypothetical protein